MIRAFPPLTILLLFVVTLPSSEDDSSLNAPMTLESFARVTLNIVQEDGISEYLPTLVLLDTNEIRVIEGIPRDVDHTTAIQNVVRKAGHNLKEFFFGVLSSPKIITIGHHRPGKRPEFMLITETSEGLSIKALDHCDWWKIE
jgi:hypothetical protein